MVVTILGVLGTKGRRRMEYQILLEMIKELREAQKPLHGGEGLYYSFAIGVLLDLQRRIDKAREADIIAMSNEGCI